MIALVREFMYIRFVASCAETFDIQRLIADKTVFLTFVLCRYVTDVTFQQNYRLQSSLEEVKILFSEKHKPYGFSFEASVLPNGLATSVSNHYPRVSLRY